MDKYREYNENDFWLNKTLDTLKPIEVEQNWFFKLGDDLET